MDCFTKYLNLYALPDQRATTVAKGLFEAYISHHGVPQGLHTDQGRQFESDLIKDTKHGHRPIMLCQMAWWNEQTGL